MLVVLHPKTYRYASTRADDGVLRTELKELPSQRRRFGYRRLGPLLARQGVRINHKKLYRLYKEKRLSVRKREWSQTGIGRPGADDNPAGLTANLTISRSEIVHA